MEETSIYSRTTATTRRQHSVVVKIPALEARLPGFKALLVDNIILGNFLNLSLPPFLFSKMKEVKEHLTFIEMLGD